MFDDAEEKLSFKEYLAKKPFVLWVVIVLLTVIGLGFGGFGLFQLISTNDQEIVTSNDIESQVCEQSADFGQITVYISGAVKKPGVYILSSNDRVSDLIDNAGGPDTNADKVYINKELNLAKKLTDADQIYIPTIQETEEQIFADQLSIETSVTQQQTDNQNDQKIGPISINYATKEQLLQLTGIGEVKASKIIENRPYLSVSELVEKEVITQSVLEKIESQIVI